MKRWAGVEAVMLRMRYISSRYLPPTHRFRGVLFFGLQHWEVGKTIFSSCFWLDPKANKNQGPIKGDFCSSKTAVAFYRCMLRSAVGDSKCRHRRYFLF